MAGWGGVGCGSGHVDVRCEGVGQVDVRCEGVGQVDVRCESVGQVDVSCEGGREVWSLPTTASNTHPAFAIARNARRLGATASLLRCLDDPDSETRKFAAFAVGNLVFHGDTFYAATATAVPALVRLLADPAPKARGNAAGHPDRRVALI